MPGHGGHAATPVVRYAARRKIVKPLAHCVSWTLPVELGAKLPGAPGRVARYQPITFARACVAHHLTIKTVQGHNRGSDELTQGSLRLWDESSAQGKLPSNQQSHEIT